MHEYAVTKNLMSMLVKEADKHNITPKEAVIELGEMTTYKKDPIQFYFDSMKKEYPVLKDTELEIKEIPSRLKCNGCGSKSARVDPLMVFCQGCDSQDVEIIQGKDIVLKEIR